jgi:acyl-CoA thioester hydrolase
MAVEDAHLLDLANAPALFFAPFVSSTMRVEAPWIDYNGHLNMAYYSLLFDRAADEAFGLIGLGPDYLERRGASYFLAESRLVYRRELKADDPVRATVQLLDIDDKRLHYYMELHHAVGGWLSATAESLALHVDVHSRKVVPFPPDILANFALMKASHARLPRPQTLGQGVRMPHRSDAAAAGASLIGTTRH